MLKYHANTDQEQEYQRSTFRNKRCNNAEHKQTNIHLLCYNLNNFWTAALFTNQLLIEDVELNPTTAVMLRKL